MIRIYWRPTSCRRQSLLRHGDRRGRVVDRSPARPVVEPFLARDSQRLQELIITYASARLGGTDASVIAVAQAAWSSSGRRLESSPLPRRGTQSRRLFRGRALSGEATGHCARVSLLKPDQCRAFFLGKPACSDSGFVAAAWWYLRRVLQTLPTPCCNTGGAGGRADDGPAVPRFADHVGAS